MKSLLEIEFPSFYNLNRKIIVNEEEYSSDFTVTDKKSCTDCKNKTPDSYNQCYDKIVLKVSTTEKVKLISLENYFQQYSNKKGIISGGTCDYLLYGQDKIVFAELTCCRPIYLYSRIVNGKLKEGKRSKVEKQIGDTIERLSVCPKISERIASYNEKIAIFSLRKKESAFDNTDEVIKPMNSFMRMTNEQTTNGIAQQMENGFKFIINEYPQSYQW
jgi:hypothetical protein